MRGANRPKLALHVPEPPFRPGDKPDFSSLKVPAAGEAPRPDTSAPAAETHPLTTHLVRVLGDDHKAVGAVGPEARRRHLAQDAQGHGHRARLRRPHVPLAAAGEDQLLHEMHRRGGDRGRRRRRARPRGHALPDLSPAGAAGRARLSAGRDDEPDLFEQGRQAERPPAADHVFGQGARLLLDLGQPRHAIPAGGRLGDGRGDQGRQPDRHGLDRRRRDRGRRLPLRADLRRGLQRAGHPRGGEQPVGDLQLLRDRRRRARDLRAAGGRLWHRRAARRRQ